MRICLEPNPKQYGCEIGDRVESAAQIVRAVRSPWMNLVLDTGCCEMMGDSFADAVLRHHDILAHVHVSMPDLGTFESASRVQHRENASALRDVGYHGAISLEMRQPNKVDDLKRATCFLNEVYGP